MNSYIVAIVGRPNVGKSTLFNRLLGYQKAIVDNVSGVTRDRQYGIADWNGKSFHVIDTGGFVKQSDDIFEKEIAKQVLIAIDEADCILFTVDVATGLTSMDESIAKMLYKFSKKIIVVVNKVDNGDRLLLASEFYGLGFDHLISLSSISGSGTGELLDEIARGIPAEQEEIAPAGIPKFAIIGQPNVGKSSFLNVLIGEERSIVSNVAGTTRDSIFTKYNLYQKEFILIDTAGIRKKKNMDNDLEYYSVIRAVKAMDESDILLLMVDATLSVTHQDLTLYQMAIKKGKGIVVLVNKWDLIEKTTNTAKEMEDAIKKRLAPFSDVPIVFISTLEKTRIFKAIEVALEVFANQQLKVSTKVLNEFVKECTQQYQAPVYRGHSIKIKFITQLPTRVISFALFCNYPEGVKPAYQQYLENQFRKKFPLTGIPFRLFFRKNSSD